MATDTFREGLEALGYTVELKDTDKVIIPLTIAEGRFSNQNIRVGFQVPGDFPMSSPSGPHIAPRLIPISNAQDHTRAAESPPFGAEWLYLSRPFSQWAHKRTVKRYMEYVTHLLNTL